MKRTLAALLLSGALLLPAADIAVPIERFKLANGLRVVVSSDHAVPMVTVYMIYDVGARSEEKGRTGFAHLFEHMMFQGSANIPKGGHFSAVERNGGQMNGSTHPDYTDYFESMPANKLATALWLESDRMRSLAITEENLANQKEAVKQERRLNFDNRPYNTAISDVWPTLAFRNWGSNHSIIGSFEDLNAATVADVSKFFKTYYAPNNAVLAIAGDVQLAQVKKLVETYFGDIPSQPQPKHPDLAEPPGFEPRLETYKDKLARVPIALVGYPGPTRRSPDYYALIMLDAILTAGESSRLHQTLVKEKQTAIQVGADLGFPFANPQDYKEPNLYALQLVYNPKGTGPQIVEQAQEVLKKLQGEPVSGEELARVRTQIRADRIRALETSSNRARALARYELLDGKAEFVNTELDTIMAVTPAQIQAVAKKYLTPDKRVVLDIVPAPAAAKEAR